MRYCTLLLGLFSQQKVVISETNLNIDFNYFYFYLESETQDDSLAKHRITTLINKTMRLFTFKSGSPTGETNVCRETL